MANGETLTTITVPPYVLQGRTPGRRGDTPYHPLELLHCPLLLELPDALLDEPPELLVPVHNVAEPSIFSFRSLGTRNDTVTPNPGTR